MSRVLSPLASRLSRLASSLALSLALLPAFAPSAWAETYTYCGAAGGSASLSTANAWKNSSGNKCTIANTGGNYSNVIVFDCEAINTNKIDIYCANDGWKLGELRVLNGTVRLHALYNVARMLNFGNATNEIYVAEGATLELYGGCTVSGALNASASAETIVKTGPGTLKVGDKSGLGTKGVLKTFYAKEGSLPYCGSADGIKMSGAFVVGPGCKVTLSDNNQVENNTVVCVLKGATYTTSTDTLGAFVGEGTVTASSTVTVTLPAAKGPFVFSGTMSGTLLMSGTSTDETRYWLIGSTNAFRSVSFTPAATAVGAKPYLRFLPGIGRFNINWYNVATGQPLCLEDTNGAPVTVACQLQSASTASTTGCGTLYHTGQGDGGYTFTGDALANTGEIWSGNSYNNLYLGNNTSGNDIDLSVFSGFGSSYALYFRNYDDQTLGGPVRGSKNVYADGVGHLTVPSVAMDSTGVFSVEADRAATVRDVTYAQRIDVKANAALDVDDIGGTLAELKVCAGAAADVKRLSGTLGCLTFAGTDAAVEIANADLSKGGTVSLKVEGKYTGTSLGLSNVTLRLSSPFAPYDASFRDCRLWITGSIGPTVGTASSPQTLFLDDVDLTFGTRGFTSFTSLFGSSETCRATVGTGGLRIDGVAYNADHGVSMGGLSAADGGSGEVSVDMGGRMTVNATWAGLTGPVVFRGGRIVLCNGFATSGDTTFGDVAVAADAVIAAAFASGAGSRVTVTSAASVSMYGSGSSRAIWTFGPSDAALDAALARTAGGVLLLSDSSGSETAFDGAHLPCAVTVNGGLSNTSSGITAFPLFSYTAYRADGAQTARQSLQFLRYDATKGLVEVYGTPWAELAAKTSGDIALVDGTATAVLDGNASLGGLRVFGAPSGVNALEIAADATLTLGAADASTAVILVNNTHARNGPCVIGGAGTIDFGAREGIVCANLAHSGTYPSAINCRLAGTGGLTLVAQSETDHTLSLGAANAYTGGTRIRGGVVRASAAGCFGTGPVTVSVSRFTSGAVSFQANGTWANDIAIDGTPVDDGNAILRFAATDTVLAGAVAIAGETVFGTSTARSKGTFDGVISGTGDLTLSGSGTIAFGAANTYVGTTTVDCPALTLKDGATFGTGDVVLNGATLRFENASDVTVANRITGTGRIVVAGTGRVTFADKSGFAGAVVAERGTADLAGEDLATDGLAGAGAYANGGAAARLVAGGAYMNLFSGTVSGAIDLVKEGTGVQYLSGANDYSGDTLVSSGRLVLGEVRTSATLPVTDNIVRLDANAALTMREGSETDVRVWADADGGDYAFVANDYKVAGTTNCPTLLTDHVNGLNALQFPNTPIRLVAEGKACSPVMCFGVVGFGHDGISLSNNAGLFGKAKADTGIRSYGATYCDTDNYFGTVNGVAGYTHAIGQIHAFSRDYAKAVDWSSPAVGDYFSNGGRPFGGCACELVFYARRLTDTEFDAVNDYLMVKWGLRESVPFVKHTDILPATTHLTVAAEGTLDLAGSDQTLASLDLSGTLENAAPLPSRHSVLTLTGASYVRAGATVNGARLRIVLGPGAVLDLGGGTYTVYSLAGPGTVVNGTLNTLRKGFAVILK